MGCVSSNLLNHEDELGQLTTSALGHHIVSLTSTTYGLLNTLDPTTTTTTPPPPSRFSIKPLRSEPPEIINSWELMEGLDTESFRFSPLPPSHKENSNPNRNPALKKPVSTLSDRFEKICPPNGEKKVVIYTTTLRGVRRTFEACNAVRAAFDAFGVQICERDVSMDSGFKEELRELLKGKEATVVPPRVFVKGFYIGGAEEMLKVVEEGLLGEVLQGLPRKVVGGVCEGCGDMRFLPCFRCNGSCKMVLHKQKQGNAVVVKCSDCNENGLVLCPLCS
ncbi:glutaredoxin family protein [Trifolium pratense]|uniref:Glutaredoxin family protein n=1 Tax=Trifolium pratense TaxID=57577 RepID=A0A2K3JXF8_TRIPR|nr:uncharacterized protein At5g39865 [Trifolium pratense]PNX58676.1 glutaredoxin family protein [Trifolium pratense]